MRSIQRPIVFIHPNIKHGVDVDGDNYLHLTGLASRFAQVQHVPNEITQLKLSKAVFTFWEAISGYCLVSLLRCWAVLIAPELPLAKDPSARQHNVTYSRRITLTAFS